MDPTSVPPFLTKTYEMVDDRSSDNVVAWSDGNNSFVVSDLGRFQTELLPKYFKHGNFASFVRQLNTYGFRKVNSDRLEFANEAFLRGQKNLLQTILRRKHGNHPPQVQSSQAAVCIEMGKIGLKEDVEILQRDKNVLMQELVRLRQQQQATDHQLETVGQHMQMMEQRQQQMMSFLAKAMQSPGFLGQLVQKQSDSNCLVARGSKKRRFSRQDELNSVSGSVNDSSNIHIVRLHSSMNEAAKSMLHQILKMNSSRRDPVRTNSGPLLLDNLPCNSLENCSSASRITEVMLPKDLLSNGKSSVPVDHGFHGNPVDANVQFVQSMVTDQLEQKHLMDFNSQIYGQGESVPNFTEMPGNVTESFNGIPTAIPLESFSNPDFVDQLPSTINMATPGPSDPPEHDADILMDNMPVLPSINDVFWEQFLTASPPPLDIDELDLIIPESNTTKDQKSVPWQENGWDKFQRLNDLSEQMELLTSASAGV